MSADPIRPDQVWESRDGKRRVTVIRFAPFELGVGAEGVVVRNEGGPHCCQRRSLLLSTFRTHWRLIRNPEENSHA